MLIFEAASYSFGAGPVLSALDLRVTPGEVVVLLGSSGCGKTTTLRLASGLIAPQTGRVSNGFRRTAVVFQEPRLMPWASALDNAAFGLKAMGLGRGERRERAAQLLLRLGFSRSDLEKHPTALSGGMAQRVAVARALAVGPDLLLMDEPFTALDSSLRSELQDMLRDEVVRAGAAALFVTHDAPEAVRLADRIAVLSGNPARISAEVANRPVSGIAAVYAAAAAFLASPDVAAALGERRAVCV
ncbi:ABC transporter ATP-binding protein [Rhodomicrobium sp.]|uniref:ABC transporter ATP-binding protein n=1 Tax=Rhodomicrobium sp. TaxID=2720632 RepID=UPI0039E4876F